MLISLQMLMKLKKTMEEVKHQVSWYSLIRCVSYLASKMSYSIKQVHGTNCVLWHVMNFLVSIHTCSERQVKSLLLWTSSNPIFKYLLYYTFERVYISCKYLHLIWWCSVHVKYHYGYSFVVCIIWCIIDWGLPQIVVLTWFWPCTSRYWSLWSIQTFIHMVHLTLAL